LWRYDTQVVHNEPKNLKCDECEGHNPPHYG
jgi:hypothetical protein